MNTRNSTFEYQEYASADELPEADAALLRSAMAATGNAYAPFSRFRVGAAAVLEDGTVVNGSNQESASFPVGICAERVLLSVLASQFAGKNVKAIAVTYQPENGISDHPISPCGICRQSLMEFELRQQQPIRLILGGATGKIFVLPDAQSLLPLAFSGSEL
jgi:cytidine deaminase